MIAKRRQIFQWYRQRLSGVSELTMNVERFWARNIYWMTSVVLGEQLAIGRDDVMAGLKERGVDSRPFSPRLAASRCLKAASERTRSLIASRSAGLICRAGII